MFFEHVAIGPSVQGVIECPSTARLHGLPQQAIPLEPRADGSRRKREAFLVADSTWRHIS
jgi:hypothetical protein